MAEDLPNLSKLIKLLKMTTSSNDAEALAFLRKANAELVKFGGDWESLLRGKVTVIGDPFDGCFAAPVPPPPTSNYRYTPPPAASQPQAQYHYRPSPSRMQSQPRTKAKVRNIPTVDML